MAKEEIDPRLFPIGKATCHKTQMRFLEEMFEMGLVGTRRGKVRAVSPMTQYALEATMSGLVEGFSRGFARATHNLGPEDELDEVSLGQEIMEGQGKPIVRIRGGVFGIRFDGRKPIVKRVVTYLESTKDGKPGMSVRLLGGMNIKVGKKEKVPESPSKYIH